MGILDRFTTIVKANINELLDKAEDPAKMVDQYLVDLTESLADVKRETAGVMAEEARTKRAADANAEEVSRMEDLAKKALKAGNEGDARVFLAKKQKLETAGAELQKAADAAKANADKMRQMHDKLVSDIEDLKSRRETIKAKMAVAKTQEKVAGYTSGADKAESAIEAFNRMEEKADRMLDTADAMAELNTEPVDDAESLAEKRPRRRRARPPTGGLGPHAPHRPPVPRASVFLAPLNAGQKKPSRQWHRARGEKTVLLAPRSSCVRCEVLRHECHLAGALFEHVDGLVGLPDVGDGLVHGALTTLGAVADVRHENVVADEDAGGEKDRAAGPGHDGGEDRLRPEHGIEERGGLADDLVGDGEALEAAALGDHLEERLHAALVADDDLVAANGHEGGVLVGDEQGTCKVEVGGVHVFNPPSPRVNSDQAGTVPQRRPPATPFAETDTTPMPLVPLASGLFGMPLASGLFGAFVWSVSRTEK